MTKSSFNFTNPKLEKLSFQVNEEWNGNKEQIVIGVSKPFVEELCENSAIVKLFIKVGQNNDEYSPFFVNVLLSARFEWEENLKDDVDELLRVNACVLLYSYARQIIATTTVQSGLPPYHLPFMDFTKD
jgi:preprotein translocase subunit SecB